MCSLVWPMNSFRLVHQLHPDLRVGGHGLFPVRYKRFRIVLNRRKIKRIDTVSVEDG